MATEPIRVTLLITSVLDNFNIPDFVKYSRAL